MSTAAGPSGSAEDGIDLDPEFRAELRELARSLPKLSYYELLELPRAADAAAVRDGFFQQSKRYHPDRYFRRNIGPYRDLINEIYKRVVAAHDVLRDPDQRRSYDQTLGPESALEAEPSTQTRTRTASTPPTPTPHTATSPTPTPRTPIPPAPGRPAAPAAAPAKPAAQPAPSLRSRSGLRSRGHLLGGLENQIELAKSKAERRYQEAMVKREAGAWADAAALLRMAMAFAPREERYRKAFEELAPLANAEQWDPLESTCRHASLSIL